MKANKRYSQNMLFHYKDKVQALQINIFITKTDQISQLENSYRELPHTSEIINLFNIFLLLLLVLPPHISLYVLSPRA